MNEGKKRIDSIDALRAFALLGILLVHTAQLYDFNNPLNDFSYFSSIGVSIQDLICQYGSGRFVILFSILFGLSFYLILRNPNYSQKKFLWRCILLICFGLVNKLFYTSDILVWYGLNGIILSFLPVRKVSASALLTLALFFYVSKFYLNFDLEDFILSDEQYSMRYDLSIGIEGIFKYPYLYVLKEIVLVFNGNGAQTLSYFIFGFYLGKIEVVDKLHMIGLKTVFVFVFISFWAWIIYRYSDYSPNSRKLYNFVTAVLYASFFLYIYKHKPNWFSLMRYYGRLGLTNYSFQNVFFPLAIPLIIFPVKMSFEYIIFFSLFIYVVQLFFSAWWLKKHRFGPLEFIWRSFTDRRIMSNSIEKCK